MAILILIVRVAIGVTLIVAGALKAHDGIALTSSTIAAYRILPPAVVTALAVFLPYFEIGLGLYLVLGLLIRIVGLIAAAQFIVFAGAVSSLVIRHIPASCGCFGAGQNVPPTWGHVAIDLLLALICIGIAQWGPGALAVDALMGHRHERETHEPTGEPAP
jgi:uncharacterized membrane protein YphA (DoxX/SURF4 family)